MKLVFPTAASPAKTTLYVRSGGPLGSSSRASPTGSGLRPGRLMLVDNRRGVGTGVRSGLGML